MKRPTITFTDTMYEKLNNRMREKGLRSISECARELIDLGLRVEEAAAQSSEKEEENDLFSEILTLKKLLQSNLVWSLEARLLARFLVEAYPNVNSINKGELLQQYKMKAQNHVNKLVVETVK